MGLSWVQLLLLIQHFHGCTKGLGHICLILPHMLVHSLLFRFCAVSPSSATALGVYVCSVYVLS